jgi:dTDP-4-dehydrorhamnose reductase
MRILVTGATGQVGGALAAALRHRGTVVATNRAQLDLAQPEKLSGVLDEIAPDIIVNPAAYTAVDQAEDEPALAMRVNATAPGVIAQWAANKSVPLIHFSTDYVFDGTGERAWREDDATGPLSVYGTSKLAGEEAVRNAGGPCLIMRTSWVYAASGKNFLRTVARLARTRDELRVVADQIGAPTSATLIAHVVARVLAGGSDDLHARIDAANGLVHVAAAGETSWYHFTLAIVEGLRTRGVKLAAHHIVALRSDEYPTKAKRPRNSRLDLTRLREVFAVEPVAWEQALVRELDLLAREMAV